MARTKNSMPHPRTCSRDSTSVEGPILAAPNQPTSSSPLTENLVAPSPTPMGENLVMAAPSSEIHENIHNNESGDNVEHVENVENEEDDKKDEKGKRSKVWNEFTKEMVKDKNGIKELKAICSHCKHALSLKSGNGTSHLIRHLDTYCKRKKKGSKDIKQLLLSNSSKESGGQLMPFKFNQEGSRRSLAKFIICAELPFRIVEHPSFVEFVKGLQPLFHCVSRVTVRNDCVALYEAEKKKLHDLLKNLKCHVSFTSDMWTSNQKLGYMTLTAHYVNDDFVLKKKILSFKKVPYPHTSYVVSEILWNCIVDWELDDRLLALTLDNASTNDSVVTKLKGNYGEKMLLNGDHIHVRCCSHILNILVQDGLKAMDDAIDNVRNVVRYVGATPSRMQVFNEIASQKRPHKRKGLVLDVSTRWNSTYDMLASALVYKEAFMMYVQEHGHSSLPLTYDNWKKADSICKFLEHFAEATKVFSGFKYPTSNLYFKEVWNIRGLLMEEAHNSDETVRNLVSEMQFKFDKYWKHCSMFLCIASVLDPRLKLGYISFSYEKEFGKARGQKMVDEILVLLNDLYASYESASSSNVVCENALEGSSSVDLVGNKRRHDLDYMQWWSKQQKLKNLTEMNWISIYRSHHLL